jgi:hypothetical protein
MTKAPMRLSGLKPGRVAVLGVLVASGGLLVAACGGSPSNAAVAHLATTTTTKAAGSQKSNSPSGGGSGSAAGVGPGQAIADPAGRSGSGQALAYAECMRSHGVPSFPDPNAQGGFAIQGGPGSSLNPGSATFQAADKTCRHLLPNDGQPTAAQQAHALAQALKFSQCMRSHGLADFPDPQSQPGGGIAIRIHTGPGQASNDLNPQSPQFQAAQNACQGIMGGAVTKSGSAGGGKGLSAGGKAVAG